MPRVHAEAKRAQARQLREAGGSLADVGAQLGVHPSTIAAWERGWSPDAELEVDVGGLPVRLAVKRGALRDQLVLERGPERLALLGVRRRGWWDLSLAGRAHERSLRIVLPTVLARAARDGAAPAAFTVQSTPLPARATPRRPAAL